VSRSARRRAELQTELEQLFERENRGGADRTESPATYLKVAVRK